MLAMLLMVLFLICAVLLILLILVQKGRGGGLAAAFGGGGANSAFGTKTADVLTKVTGGLALAFFLLSVIMAIHTNRSRTAAAGETGQTQNRTDDSGTVPPPEGGGTPPAPPVDEAPEDAGD